jgi:hypothetical protein
MSERTLSDAIGIDAGSVEALGRAGVQTIEQLADADPDTVAMASGIPVDRIREWQQKAQGPVVRPGPSPVAKGWMVGVIGVVIALALGWVLIAIGSAKIRKAEGIRAAAESKLRFAVSFGAEEAIEEIREARLSLHGNNWGSAQAVLSSVEDKVTLMEQVSPDGMKDDVANVRQLIGDLQNAVTQQSPEASNQLDELEAALDRMRQAE